MATPTKQSGSAGPEDIKAQVETLSADVAELARLMRELAGHQAEAAKDAGARALRQGQAQVEAGLDEALGKMRENPGTTLAIAAGVGFLVGLLLSPRR